MYLQEIPENVKTTTLIKIKYDCCNKEHTLKHKDAQKNFEKNNHKHICRKCWLKSSDNPAKDKKIQEKIKQTNMEKYGATCVLNSKENIQTRVEKMFGSQEAIDQIVKARKETNIKKYGVDHPMKNEQVKAKQQDTLIDKYGTHVPLKNEEIKLKMQNTVKEKYGVDNVAQLQEVQDKMSKTMTEKYGVERYNQLPIMKEYLRLNCPEWLKKSWANGGPMKGITRPEEWNEKQRETVSKLIDEGKWNSGSNHSVKGRYQSQKCKRINPIFRSSYELKVHWYLDNDSNVEWYDYEPFKIHYYDTSGIKRYYIIDFVVKYFSGSFLAIEVKNDYASKLALTLIKKEAFQKVCDYIKYEIWSNDKINSLNFDTKTLLKSPLVVLF